MKNMFFYGSLVHIPLLEIVLGRKLGDHDVLNEASLDDHAVYWVRDQVYPTLVEQSTSVAKGVLLTDLSAQDFERLDFYEGGYGYALKTLTVHTNAGPKQAQFYVSNQDLPRGDYWDIDIWQAKWGAISILAATEAMKYFGQITADELTERFGPIRRRAASFHRGQSLSGRHATNSRGDVQVIEQRTPYSNFYAVQEYDFHHRKFNGDSSDIMERGVFVAYDAAIVLPYDPVLDCVLLVEQFRIGAYAHGAKQPWLLEPVAGLVDVGETPEQAAMRETVEEAGVHLDRLIPISQAFPSPGNSTEHFYIYLGLCDLSGAGGRVTGVEAENEDIRSHILSFVELMDFVNAGANGAGGANVLPLIAAAYWLALNRDDLLQGA